MKTYDCVIVGGGSAGMSAAIAAYDAGVKDLVILERDRKLGGILQQCIHNGFGLHTFGEELTGPSYALRYEKMVREREIPVKLETMVLSIENDKTVTYTNPQEGVTTIKARSIILCMGCMERNRGAIGIPGSRPAGVWTAGTAQRYLNLDGYLVGKKVFILGSGDIGLIMARRMTLEGAKVLGVAELMPYSNGLPRNMKQCLEDFDIPLYLSHTVTKLEGKDRLEKVTISQVGENKKPIPGTEKVFEADTLLLSVGLIPENSLSKEAGVVLHQRTRGAIVSESLETSIEGIFACGNVLHVHDLVDFVSKEGEKAGKSAAKYIQGTLSQEAGFTVKTGDGISYCVPGHINSSNLENGVECMFRVTDNFKNAKVQLIFEGKVIKEWKKQIMIPAEMQKVMILKKNLEELSKESDQKELLLKIQEEKENVKESNTENNAATEDIKDSQVKMAATVQKEELKTVDKMTENKKVIEMPCITCPMSCHLKVIMDETGQVESVTGNTCKRGEQYARSELTNPVRMLTSTVTVENGEDSRIPIITKEAIPKDGMFSVMEEIHKTKVCAPVKENDIIVKNVCNLGIDLIATGFTKEGK